LWSAKLAEDIEKDSKKKLRLFGTPQLSYLKEALQNDMDVIPVLLEASIKQGNTQVTNTIIQHYKDSTNEDNNLAPVIKVLVKHRDYKNSSVLLIKRKCQLFCC
jgi:hypothetical protein